MNTIFHAFSWAWPLFLFVLPVLLLVINPAAAVTVHHFQAAKNAICAPLLSDPNDEPVIKAGAYYFDGWTGKTDAYHLPERLRVEFADRRPVWGWVTSTPEIMRQQIDCAADYGLRFFSFCWYYPQGEDKSTPLNHALNLFLGAPNQKRLEFCLLVANHSGFCIGPDEWNDCCDRWLTMFKHPSYLKANGMPLLVFFSPYELNRSFGGPKAVHSAFDFLRQKAKQAGLPGVSIAGCWTARNVGQTLTLPQDEVESGYTFVTGYSMPHYCAWDWPKKLQSYQHLIDGHQKAWDLLAAQSPLPYIPVATLGYDRRPWEKPGTPQDQQSIRYPDPEPEQVHEMIQNAAAWIHENAKRTADERILMIYAWNEYGEGGYITPTEKEGHARLEAIKRALIPDK